MRKYSGKLKINILMFVYISAWILIPVFRNTTDSGILRVLFIIISFLWFMTSFMLRKNWLNRYLIPITISSLYLIFMVLYYIFGYGNIELSRFVQPFFIYLMVLIGSFYFTLNNEKIDKLLIKFIIIFFMITAITTIYNLSININAARILTSSSTSLNERAYLESKNIGSFDFIFGSILFLPILIFNIKNIKISSKLGVLNVIILVMITLLIIMSNFTTAYIFLAISIFLLIIPSRIKLWRTIVISVSIIIIILPLIFSTIIDLLQLIKNVSPSIMMQIKIENIINFLAGKNNLFDVSGRFILLKNSVMSFIHSPIIGVGAYYGATSIVGDHSQFIDDLARYGIFANISLFFLFYYYIRETMRALNTGFILNGYKISLIYFIALGILNPVYSYGILLTIFVLIPLLARVLERSYNVRKSNRGTLHEDNVFD